MRASDGSDGGGGGCRVGGGSAVTTIDGATKLAGGIGGDVRRLSAEYYWGVSRYVVFMAVLVAAATMV